MSDQPGQGRLDGLEPTQPPNTPLPPPPDGLVVRVLPDVLGIDKEFDYLAPEGVPVAVGDVVRVQLGGRRVGGWVIAVDVEPTPGVRLIPLAKVSGRGPAPDVVDLAGWAAWRWVGRRANFLRSASPPAVVRSLPRSNPLTVHEVEDPSLKVALGHARCIYRLPPAADRYPLVLAAARAPTPVVGGQTLLLCPSVSEARRLGRRLRTDGVQTAVLTETGAAGAGEWARAAAGAVVVGARAAAWAPMTPLGRVVVLDEHDEAYQEEASPTWHARDVVIERAARAGAPCLLVSPTPTLEALQWGTLVVAARNQERAGWPRIQVVDQRDLDPTLGPLFSPDLVNLVRGEGRIVCVLNRTGRARMLACGACDTLARCERCDAAVATGETDHELVCSRCGMTRPALCLACGGTRLKNLRLGVSRAREELSALAGEDVVEVTGATDADPATLDQARILIGTEAVLHRVGHCDAVAFLDFDQQLLAHRYRTAEQALALLARAARLVRRVGAPHGRILVQTRTPDHPVIEAAVHADPTLLTDHERPLRAALGLPPTMAMALVSGQAGPAFMVALGEPDGITIQGPVDDAWRLRAVDHEVLCDALNRVVRPAGRLRIEVDPLGI